MSFLRKASLKKKKSDEIPSPKGARGDRPPKSRSTRSVSEASSMTAEGDPPPRLRKTSLTSKGKKRLSSLFSSSSLSSFASERDASPRGPSNLNISTSTSGASTPTRNGSVQASGRYSALDGKGLPPEPVALADGVKSIRLGSDEVPVTDSPTGSPITPTALGKSAAPVLASGEQTVRRQREPSLYSQWDDDEESSDEELAFMTPSEGLSEVEEEEEEQIVPVNGTSEISKTEADSNASRIDVAGTGPSTISRHHVAVSDTKVIRRAVTAKSALSVNQAKVLAQDVDTCREVLTLFLTSHMREAEELCHKSDPDGNHLYLQSAHGIIQALKGMMTFDSIDLHNALEICKGTAVTASALRKPSDGLVTRLGGLVKSGAGVARVKAMTPLERHAELVYAETSLMKAMLAIIAGGDWLGLVREALNMRTAHGIYRTLQQYLEEADKDAFDEDIDMDFRSGVLLGTGTSSLMLSLLPGKVLKIAEVFGYAGDRKVALDTLMAAGGWSKDSTKPAYDENNEGIRRPVCDMILLAFHLVISVLMPVTVDIGVARNILAYNMRRYPDGVFFLYFQARLNTAEAKPELANKCLQRALDLKLEYVQLQHMCLWDYACNFLMLGNWKGALDCFSILKNESNWSRAVYTYASAACLVELVHDGYEGATIETADGLMKEVPKLTKKLAGKSLPIEARADDAKKLASRKTRKFEAQGKTLFLPAMELAYVFGSLSNTPRKDLLNIQLPRIDRMLAKLEKSTPEEYGNGHDYWDDYCLGHFLRGVVQFTARYQPPEAADSAKVDEKAEFSDEEIDHGAEKDFLAVLRHGPDVQLDHYIIYHCHYELGKLYARRGDSAQAKKNFDVVMSGKLLEVNPHEKKSHGKYSLEGALLLKTHAALQSLKESNGE